MEQAQATTCIGLYGCMGIDAPSFRTYLSTICNLPYMSSVQFIETSDVGLHVVVYITEELLCSFGCQFLFGFCAAHGETGLLEQRPKRAKPSSRCESKDLSWHAMSVSKPKFGWTDRWNLKCFLWGFGLVYICLYLRWKSAVECMKCGQTLEKRAINTWV